MIATAEPLPLGWLTIAAFHREIPPVPCIEGCTDCCGPVPFTLAEWARVPEKRQATHSRCCPYANNGCDIYDQRPLVCRLFGAVADEPLLECPHGRRAARPLTKQRRQEMMSKYLDIMAEETGDANFDLMTWVDIINQDGPRPK